MLMLTRRPGQSVDLIDQESDTVIATVTLIACLPGNQVRLGFDAPQHIHIVRDDAKRRNRDEDENDHDDDQKGEYNGNR
jgi:carbon storage regulator CsrA